MSLKLSSFMSASESSLQVARKVSHEASNRHDIIDHPVIDTYDSKLIYIESSKSQVPCRSIWSTCYVFLNAGLACC